MCSAVVTSRMALWTVLWRQVPFRARRTVLQSLRSPSGTSSPLPNLRRSSTASVQCVPGLWDFSFDFALDVQLPTCERYEMYCALAYGATMCYAKSIIELAYGATACYAVSGTEERMMRPGSSDHVNHRLPGTGSLSANGAKSNAIPGAPGTSYGVVHLIGIGTQR